MDTSVVNFLNGTVFDLPVPKNISYFWNMGSLIGLFLIVQVVSGVFLSFFYVSDVSLSFGSVDLLVRDVWFGWLVRLFHSNGASFFFFFLYAHVARGLYYGSYFRFRLWLSGFVLLVVAMAIAFLGYVLPWGQMSYWGSVVITNLFSVFPFVGDFFVCWLWGGFSVCGSTLTRFFSIHFLLPFIMLFVVVLHVVFLHDTGSNNVLGMFPGMSRVSFFPFFVLKDFFGFFASFWLFFFFVFISPYLLMDSENFIEANSLVTPVHIQPEWYFLPAYAILRSIPNKFLGVVGLALFVVVFLFLPFCVFNNCYFLLGFVGCSYYFGFFAVVLFLGFLGACPVEYPYVFLSQVGSFFYFYFFVYEFSYNL